MRARGCHCLSAWACSSSDLAAAVLYVWYPGEQGGAAVADILFGAANPSGRLPVTVPQSVAQLPDLEDYAMRGRTYRYMAEQPLYPFGFGLSYTRFEYGPLKLSRDKIKPGKALSAELTVTNVGQRAGEEVVQLYIKDEQASVPAPNWALKAFKRIELAPGESKAVKFKITPQMMELVTETGEPAIEPGGFTVLVGGGSPGPRAQELGAARPATARFDVVPATNSQTDQRHSGSTR